jgi:hypothetical protein
MEEELKYIQIQIMSDITYSESIISAAEDLVRYLNLGQGFLDELELTSSTLQELLQRTSKALEPEYLKSFLLASKQVRMMAIDLLDICKQNMPSA